MIREAVAGDIPQIVELGRAFLLSGAYKDVIEDNPEAPTELAHKLLSLPTHAKVLVSISDQEKLTGVLAFIVYSHFYSGRSTAQEIIWLVDPESRANFDAVCLLRASQRIAREMGAKYMQFTAPTGAENVEKLYEMSGYTKIETGFQKQL